MQVLFYSNEFSNQSPTGKGQCRTAPGLEKISHAFFSFLFSPPLFRLSLILPRNFCVPTPDFHIQSR